jgi:hypothetical protein
MAAADLAAISAFRAKTVRPAAKQQSFVFGRGPGN